MAIKNIKKDRADGGNTPLVKEVASVSTRDVVTGRLRVSTTTDRFEDVVQTALSSESVSVTRVPIGKPIDAVPPLRTEGDLTIVSIVEEIVVVEKRLMLTEEVHIRRTMTSETIETPVTLRRQRAVVERFDETGRLIG